MELNFYRVPSDLCVTLIKKGFDLYFYDLREKARSPLSGDDLNELIRIAKNPGVGHFQILIEDFKKITDQELIEKIAEENKELLLSIDRYEERILKYSIFYKKDWNHLLKLSKAFKANDFLPLAHLIQADLSLDPQNLSVFASSVSDTLEKILRRDSCLSRMICFSYCCYQDLGYDDRHLLYDLLGAILLKDIGLSQNRAQDIFSKNEIFFKHPYYSLFLIKKLPFELTQQCYLFILDHHEKQDGSGFPRQKTGEFFHPLCDVLKSSEWIFFEKEKLPEYKRALKEISDQSKSGNLINQSIGASIGLLYSYLSE